MTLEETTPATLISAKEYLLLENPEFVGQTRVNENSEYKMYWNVNGKIYYTVNNLFT